MAVNKVVDKCAGMVAVVIRVVARLEHPKGMKDEVKQAQRVPR